MRQLDPCMSFGFLIRDQAEYTRFVKDAEHSIQHDGDFSIISLVDFEVEEKQIDYDFDLISLASQVSSHTFHGAQY